MSRYELKVCNCVHCIVFMSPLLFVILFLCVNPTTSSYSEDLTATQANLKNTFIMNSSLTKNQLLDQTSEAYSMDNIDRGNSSAKYSDIHISYSAPKASSSWSEEFLDQLYYNMRNNPKNLKNISNNDLLLSPFYNNYEDYFPPLNYSMDSILDYFPTLNESNDESLDEYDLWNELVSYSGPNGLDSIHDSNQNLTGRISSLHPFLNILSNMTGGKNTSISLSDIIFSHHLSSIISKQNKSNYEEKAHSSDNSINLPPWENLTTIQKDIILQSALGKAQKYSNGTVTGLSVYYGALLSVGIPGNGLTILIIITNSYMRTAPNIFLLSIALADLLTLSLSE